MLNGTLTSAPCGLIFLFKKHPCPRCNNILERKKREAIVNSESKEAKNYDFFNGEYYMLGNIKFVTYYFQCPKCESTYEILELKKLEKQKKKMRKKASDDETNKPL